MKPIDPAGFEAKFQADIDPWNYRASRFEAAKQRVLLRCCGDRCFGRALELACAIGVTSSALAPRCLRLLAVDSSPTAIEHARSRRQTPRLTFQAAELPAAMPRGPFDLIVMSELAYYLAPQALRRLMHAIGRALAPGGRLVVLHHLTPFGDAAQLPALAQCRAAAWTGLSLRRAMTIRTGRYEAISALRPKRRTQG